MKLLKGSFTVLVLIAGISGCHSRRAELASVTAVAAPTRDDLIRTIPPGKVQVIDGVRQPAYPEWVYRPGDNFVGKAQRYASGPRSEHAAMDHASLTVAKYLANEVEALWAQIAGDVALDSAVKDLGNVPIDIQTTAAKQVVSHLRCQEYFSEEWQSALTGQVYWNTAARCHIDGQGLSAVAERIQQDRTAAIRKSIIKEQRQEAKQKIKEALGLFQKQTGNLMETLRKRPSPSQPAKKEADSQGEVDGADLEISQDTQTHEE